MDGTSVLLSWTAADRADVYQPTRGLLSALAGGYGQCVDPPVDALSRIDDEPAPVGDGFAYLVRARDLGCGGGGSLGADSTGAERPAPCP